MDMTRRARSFAASNKGRIHSGGQPLDENGKKA
jgi:hypothetical protein